MNPGFKNEGATQKPPTPSTKIVVWENLQVAVLMLTIAGQALVGGLYLFAQLIWLVANVTSLIRDFVLGRPMADKVKNGGLVGLTLALIILRIVGIY